MNHSLGTYAQNRDNNFNLLRFIAASMVLFGHSWPLTSSGNDPLAVWFEVPFPHMAVDIFFAISGFLVTSSLLMRKNFLAFSLARLFRLIPGLLVSTLLCALIIGLYFTTLPTREYLHHAATWQYVWINSTLFGTQFSLPGVFDNLPMPGSMNGSLWTLPFEFRMYMLLGAIGLLVYVWPKLLPEKFANIATLSLACFGSTGLMLVAYGPHPEQQLSLFSLETWRFLSMFFLGGSFFILRNFIPLRHFIIGLIIITVVISKKIFFEHTGNNCLFFGVYSMLLPYVILYLAFIPRGALRKFNKLGDYSYGIYIYAYPIQQSVYSLGLARTPLQMFAIAFPITLFLAVLSWHFIEKPLLEMKDIYRPIQDKIRAICLLQREKI